MALAVLLGGARTAAAGNPRWIGGPPYFVPVGNALAWYTTTPQYYTDPGDLSQWVNHAAADQMVATAAAVWNVPTSSLVLSQGGNLAEHVTGMMVTGSGGSVTMPADVQSTNWQNIPIAVIYDADGSVIDALLGSGGSDPSGCLQNGVVESVDRFGTNSGIEHALLILNGRCTGSAPQMQTQLTYQLMRAFGRILGMGWSQLNDNVFTGSPAPTYAQAQNWPVMHPIDVVCGPYTYLCMPSPFTLRADDLSGLAQLYYIWQGQGSSMPGKVDSLADGSLVDGQVYFPNGQGMEGVNVTVRRGPFPSSYVEPWQEVSSVSGYSFRPVQGTAIAAQDGSPMESIGNFDTWREGYWRMERVPIPVGQTLQTVFVDTEPVNPLYMGPYALTEFAASSATMAPSGSSQHIQSDLLARYYRNDYNLTPSDAVASCMAGADGSIYSPAAMLTTGWWTDFMCGYGHNAWNFVSVQPNRSFTLEVTGLDETGAASAVKMMPQMGLWATTDPYVAGATVGGNPIAFNTSQVGMSQVTISQPASTQMRMVIVDQRGMGRPDFAYQARLLYADSITPANVSALGGTVVIQGLGFRSGMQVLVNGVAAQVSAATATTLTARVPNLLQLGGNPLVATVEVLDPTTGGSSTMLQALGYAAVGQRLQLVSYPTGTVADGVAAMVPFAVRLLQSDGVTPAFGQVVTVAVTQGTAVLGACGAASCSVTTDGNGMVQTTVTPGSVGVIGLKASTTLLSVMTSFMAAAMPDQIVVVSAPASTATVGRVAAQPFTVRVLSGDGVTPRVGVAVQLTAENGAALLTACGTASCGVVTDATGQASTTVTPLSAGTVMLDGTGTAGVVHASFAAAPERMLLVSAPTGLVTAGVVAPVPFAVRVVGGDGVTPMVGESVQMTATGATATLGACGAASCAVLTDGTGMAASAVTVTGVGTETLTASAASGTQTASFRSGLETMQVVGAPVGSFPDGVVAMPAMVVRVLGPDGVTPVTGETVGFATTVGSAQLGACAAASCTAVTDVTGSASMAITPESVGVIAVTATGRSGQQTVTLTGLPQPDTFQVVAGLPATTPTGVATGAARLRLVAGDGVTPVVGQAVQLAVSQGLGVLGVCGASSCTVVTDATGMIQTTLTPVLAGAVALTVTARGVAAPVVLQMAAVAVERTVVSLLPTQYVAEGVAASWTAEVGVSTGNGSAEGVPVAWTGVSGMSFAQATSPVSGSVASATASVTGMGAGVQAVGMACAWGGVCGQVLAQGVSATQWVLGVVSGGSQTVMRGAAAQPVVLRVTDGVGHPVEGVTVVVYQEVTEGQQPCGGAGRCPSGSVLGSASQGLVTDATGLVTVLPMVAGTSGGSVTEMTAVAGTQGMATADVVWQP